MTDNDDVRAVVERVSAWTDEAERGNRAMVGVSVADLRTLLAHLQREAPDAGA